jgi:transcription-repair coupling factor (superfamily II helicase)
MKPGKRFLLHEFLPENTVLWSEDWNFIKEKIEQQEEDFGIWNSEFGNRPKVEDTDDALSRKDFTENDFSNSSRTRRANSAKAYNRIWQ